MWELRSVGLWDWTWSSDHTLAAFPWALTLWSPSTSSKALWSLLP